MNPSLNSKSLSKLPTKWLVLIVFALIGYGLLQPVANRKFGWTLPSLAALLGYEEAPTAESSDLGKSDPRAKKARQSKPAELADSSDNALSERYSQADAEQAESGAVSPEVANSVSPSGQQASGAQKNTLQKKTDDALLLHGLLRDTGREDYVSPAGLHYTRGSEEGHRLKHLARHLDDQPDRPGRHGVFYGDMPQVLRWLDEAYTRASSGDKGTKRYEEDGRTVYEVNFSKPIGYMGGREGGRQKNPDSKRLRMVLDKDRVITAFPF